MHVFRTHFNIDLLKIILLYRINMEFFWNIFPNKIVQGSFSTAAGKKVDQQDKRKKDTQETKKQTSDSCTQIMWTCLSGKKK